MTRRNPTSSLRGGLDYQDLWGLKLCGDWLGNPSSFQWIMFETAPDGIETRDFYLDDILLLDQTDRYHLYQIKFKQNPQRDNWTWDDLLNHSTGSTKSLLQKWSDSFFRDGLRNKIGYAAFVTNGSASSDIFSYLREERIEIDRVKAELPQIYTEITKQLLDEQKISHFFNEFRFRFSQNDTDDLELEIRSFFYNELRATKSGVDNLRLQIQKESRRPVTSLVTLKQIREWCEFDEPKPLNEDFHVPDDFQLFDPTLHQEILEDLRSPDGGIKVIYGKPGSGKSVYLAKLTDILQQQNTIAIRHHYHISPQDPSPQERLIADRVIEAVKAQFKEYQEELGDIANKNSQNVRLDEFIGALAKELHDKGRSFVFIIDGLDHVLRYSDAEELETLLKNTCFPQPGLWIVIGMQLIAKQHLPQAVFDLCPEDRWTEIKGLNKEAACRIIEKNAVRLNLPTDTRLSDELNDRVFEITQGNPLHLRYTLQQLKNLLGSRLITEYDCRDLISYDGDIAKYYSALWRQLTEKAKTTLLTIVSVDFAFRRNQLFDCIASFEQNPAEISQGFNSVAHLILEDRRKRISIYHNSFEVFLRNQSEFEQQKIPIKLSIKRWLESKDYDDLKWAELKKLEYELGNSVPILSIDKSWLIDAICHPRNPYQVTSQMTLATEAAFESNNFAKSLELSHLHTYYQNTFDFGEEATEKIWGEALLNNDRVLDEVDFRALSAHDLEILAGIANAQGDFASIEEILEILEERHTRQTYHTKESGSAMPRVSRALLTIVPFDRKHSVERVYNYIKQFDDLGWIDDFFTVYISALLKLGQIEKVKELLSFELAPEENEVILDLCTQHDLEQTSSDFLDTIERDSNPTLFCCLYLYIKGKSTNSLPLLPEYSVFPAKVPEFASGDRQEWTKFFLNNFLTGLLYSLGNREKEVRQWISEAPEIWPAKALSALLESSLRIAGKIKTESPIAYQDLFEAFATLKKLQWPKDREILTFQVGLNRALSLAFRKIILLKQFLEGTAEITLQDLSVLLSHPFYSEGELLEFLLENEEPFLSKEAYEYFLTKRQSALKNSISTFPERASDYANLAKLSRIYKDRNSADKLLKDAANNLLGYGYHKDFFLNGALDAIDFCFHAGSNRTQIDTWIKRISPLTEYVTKYTDGDETDYIPFELAELLARQNPKLLYKNYYTKAEKEELYHAERIFEYVIQSLECNTDEQKALAATGLDKDSLEQLKEKAETSISARQALDSIQDYFGEINHPPEHESSSSYRDETPPPDYSSITPDALAKHVENIENRWDLEKYLAGWTRNWVKHGNKKEVYNLSKSLIHKIGLKNASGEMLDLIYPLAYEFDNENAFEFLCQAQANEHGWSQYWTDKKKAERRWEFLKNKFPTRHIEFFKRSISYSSGGRNQTGYFVPISRGVEFFTLFGDIENAESITEASVCFAESLMANMSLPTPEWLVENGLEEIDEVSILIQRLLWPGPLVRERAASALALLLATSAQKETIFTRLLYWIGNQSLESVVAISLLPLIKAFQIQEAMNLKHIRLEDIVNAVKVSSAVIEKLVYELSLLTEAAIDNTILPQYQGINRYPGSYTIDKFFKEYIRTFLAPIYYEHATRIEQETGLQFIKQWSFTAEEIAKENSIAFDTQVADFYGRKNSPLLMGMSSRLSEVYRSAFLRVLQHFYSEGFIPDDYYLQYAYATLPVELSLWNIQPNRIPLWWPQLLPKGPGEETNLLQIHLKDPIENLIRSESDKILIAAEGAAQPASGWQQETPVYEFSLAGFGYKVVGPRIPEAQEVANLILYRASTIVIPSQIIRPFHILENPTYYLPVITKPKRIQDLIIYPLVARCDDLTIALWQYFRDYHKIWVLQPTLAEGLKLKTTNSSWIYEDQGKEVWVFRDWLEGLKERNISGLPIPHGQYAEADSKYIKQFLDDNRLRIGYVLKTSYAHRKYSYDDIDIIEDYKLLNVSTLIL